MRLRRRPLVLLPELDGLVRLGRQKPRPRRVERRGEDAGLGLERPGLRDGLRLLEAVARPPVPKPQAAVVAPRRQHAVVVDGAAVDDGRVPLQRVVQELAARELVLFYGVGGAGREGELGRVRGQGADGLFGVGEGCCGGCWRFRFERERQREGGGEEGWKSEFLPPLFPPLSFRSSSSPSAPSLSLKKKKKKERKLTHCLGRGLPDVPQLDRLVRGPRDDLRVGRLAEERADRVCVAREAGGLDPAPHVPDARGAVAPARDEHVERRVQPEAEDAAQVAVVVAHDFVGLEVPAFDLLVERAAEQVGVPVGDGEAGDLLDVARQGQAELARREVLLVLSSFKKRAWREKKISEFFFPSLFPSATGEEEKKNSLPSFLFFFLSLFFLFRDSPRS